MATAPNHYDGMRYLYGEADEKYVKIKAKAKKEAVLSSFKFSLNPVIEGKSGGEEYDKNDVPLVFKATPDTLLNLCVNVLDGIPLPAIYTWTTDDVCKWLRQCGYKQYQNTFRKNFITGRNLLLLDASALAAMNIKGFDHIKEISRGIRSLFYFEMAKFGRNLTLYPEYHNELYKLLRSQSGAKYDVRRSDLWRKMQMIRQKEPNSSHWEILDKWLGFDKQPKYKELIGGARRTNLYAYKTEQPKAANSNKHLKQCSCLPPCECHCSEMDRRAPWRFKCLPHLKPDPEFVEICGSCIPPCTCQWSSKKYQTRSVLTCLKKALPDKYGGHFGHIRYKKYEHMTRLSFLS